MIAARMKADPRVRAVVEDARAFDELKETTGWKRLAERVKRDKDRYMAGLAARLMGGKPVSPEELAFHRGFYAGADWIIGHPEKAMESLERAASHAHTLLQVELLKQEEDESPYA